MTSIDIRNITQTTDLKKPEAMGARHLSSDVAQQPGKSDHLTISSNYIDLTAGALFLVTPDGTLHRQDLDGNYIPSITLKSYNMAASLQSSNDNAQ